MATFNLKYRDTRPTLEVALINPDRSAYDLTSASTVTLLISLTSGTVVSKTMTVDATPTTGRATYTWLATDWTVAPVLIQGTHRMEIEVVSTGGARLTFPNVGFDLLSIEQDIQ